MELFWEGDALSHWLMHYGSISVFILLALGIIALPVPEETLMVLAGVLMSKGKINVIETGIAAYAGSICGITVSYLMGRLAGNYILKRYGNWIGLTEKRLEQVHAWFERFGKWTLFIGYFVPGVRHFTGFTAGMAELEYKYFALFAYTGALVWVTVFLSLGYFVGDHWIHQIKSYEVGFEEFAVVAFCVMFAFVLYRLKDEKS